MEEHKDATSFSSMSWDLTADIEASGPYRVIKELGQGGMGTVFLARQLKPVQRKVAIKLIRFGTENDLFHSRFHVERQALALMNHPNIAAVFDAGTTKSGRPFFVMEAIDGVSITTYADEQRLSLDARLGLFEQVCSAIHHAHQKGVIHRDIKPSNILVSLRDEQPIPKIIDFGMAKGSDPSIEEPVDETPQGVALGTPLYMCPEQILRDGTDIDTRTDVYALGVVLYQLLVGAFPFETENMSRIGLIHAILNEPPLAPSDRFVGLTDRVSIARERALLPHQLVNRLRGDLDHIVLKALEKEPAARYPSVAQLSNDLKRHTRHELVSAVPQHFSYRLGKFVKRNRIWVAAGFVVLAALLLGVVGTTLGLVRAIHAREAAVEAERKALMTVEYLERVLGAADPYLDGRKVRVVDLLEKASRTVDEDLKGQDEVIASVRRTIGWTFLELGLYDRAEQELDEAIRLRTKVLGPEHRDTLNAINARGRVLYKQGRYEEAERIHRHIWDVLKRRFGEQDEDALWSMYNLAKALEKQGKLEEAERLHRRNVALRTEINGPAHPNTLISINSLCIALTAQGKHDEAEWLERRNLSTLRRVCGARHPNTLNAMSNLVVILKNQGKLEEALALCRQTLSLQLELFGDAHSETLFSQELLADILFQAGEINRAIDVQRQVVEIQEQGLGLAHRSSVQPRLTLVRMLVAQAQYEEAEGLLLELRDRWDELDPKTRRGVCDGFESVYRQWGKADLAQRFSDCPDALN